MLKRESEESRLRKLVKLAEKQMHLERLKENESKRVRE